MRNGQILQWQKLTEEDPRAISLHPFLFLAPPAKQHMCFSQSPAGLQDILQQLGFSRCFSVQWHSLATPKGPQKRSAEAGL